MRFLTGLGIGALIATTGALVAEIAPPGKKNLSSAISYCRSAAGKPARRFARHSSPGCHRLAGNVHDRRAADHHPFTVGVLKMPESVSWLVARGQRQGAGHLGARRHTDADSVPRKKRPKRSVSQDCSAAASCFATVMTGLMGSLAQYLNYYLNTWFRC